MGVHTVYRIREGVIKNTHSVAKMFLPTLLIAVSALAVMQLATASGAGPGPSVSIDQCANGGVGLTPERCATKPPLPNSNYQSGNVNGAKAHWQTGDVLPYRAVLSNLNPGTNTVTFSFDTSKSSELKHAIDYLASYDTTETTESATTLHANQNNPCGDVIATCVPASPTATAAITVPTMFTSGYPGSCANGTFTGSTLTGQQIKAWSEAVGGVSAMSLSYPDGNTMPTSGDCTPSFKITFTVAPGTSTVVLAWGGHIASDINWGTGNTVPTGSPYHMHAGFAQESPIGTLFTVGSQDLQLASTAIIPAQTPTVTTELHDNATEAVIAQGGSAALGTSVHDKATVGGTTNGTPTGTANFRFYATSAACTADTTFTTGTTAGSVSLVSGVAHPSTATGALGPGTYAFKAQYVSNDTSKWTNVIGSCETFTITQGTSGVATTLHKADESVVTVGSSVPLSTVMHDSATVTGSPTYVVPTGNVSFTFYSNGTCNGTGTTAGTVALDGTGVAHPSTSTSALAPGSYSFKASWPGDTNYTGNTSSCENFTVGKADLSLATTIHTDSSDVALIGDASLGASLHDSAQVGGLISGFTPANNVTFTFYANNTCDGAGTTAGSQAIVSGVAHPSDSQGPLTTGAYAFRAFYANDTNYNDAQSDCEPLQVDQATSSVSTAIHDGTDHVTDVQGTTLALNSSIHDKATVGGQVGAIAPTGSLTYNFYENGTCDGTPLTTDLNVALGSESSTQSNLAAGDYSFLASYSGDTNYAGSTGTCETVSVDKANTTTVTEIHKDPGHLATTSVSLGDAVHDKAIVGDQVGGFTIGGTVTYVFYTSGNCTAGGGTPETVAVGNESSATAALAAGSYSYQATYNGDTNYNGSTGDCEPLTVSKIDLNIDTELHNASEGVVAVDSAVDLGSTIHDKATVSNITTGFTPTSSVTFTFFTNGTCDGNGASAGTVALDSSGVAHPSDSQGPLAAGNYSFQATIPGDTNYNGNTSTCENFTVSRAPLGITTTIHDANHSAVTAVDLASVVHDTASVTGQVGNLAPTGDVTFHFFTSGNCTTGGSLVTTTSDGTDATRSADSAALGAGSYSFNATVASDDNYTGTTSDCEPLTVNKAQLSISTTTHNAAHEDITNTIVALGSVTHDTATVSGQVDGFAVPAVSFTLTGNYTDTCTNGTAVANDGTEGSATKSADSSALGAGNYAYSASVAGDDNYLGASSTCEPFTVNKATPTVATDIHNTLEQVVTAVAVGASVHDKASVTGQTGFDPSGTANFTFYTNGTCDGNGTAAGSNVALIAGVAHPSTVEGPLGAGSYSFKAHYNGDTNYTAQDASCEPLTVNKATPSISTTPNPSSATLGANLNDSAQLSGGFSPTGSITFKLYSPSDATCTGTPAFTQTVTVTGAGGYSTTTGFPSNATGTWRWVASYGGDTNNLPAVSGCNDEQVTVSTVATRTLGFWQTHLQFTSSVYVAHSSPTVWNFTCSPNRITGVDDVFGGFYASIPKTSTNGKRSALDQARMQLAQQLLAAILNNLAFGSGSTAQINAAKAAYCGTNANAILAAASALDTFNNSGDSQAITQNPGSADPKGTKNIADIANWDNLP